MGFTEHRLEEFTSPIAALPDTPQMTAAALKARFDACPEELREKHNAVCDESARLSERVQGIIEKTFEGAVSEAMLAPELTEKLDSKAAQTALQDESATRATADTALQTRMAQAERTLTNVRRIRCGTYVGTGHNEINTVSVGFTPDAVLVMSYRGAYSDTYDRMFTQLAVTGAPAEIVKIVSGGFTATNMLNSSSSAAYPYRYIAIG